MSENHLERNIYRIADKDKKLAEILSNSYDREYPEIRIAKNGTPIPVIHRKCLHSSYDPQAEATKWVENSAFDPGNVIHYVLGGLGFGYHLTELLKIVPADHVTIVEKDVKLAAAAFAHRQVDIFPEGLSFIIGESPLQAARRILALKSVEGKQIVFLEHPASNQIFPEYYNTIRGILAVAQTSKGGGYKILLVSPLYGGSLPITHFVHRALNSLGHRCELLDNSIFYPGLQHFNTITSHKNHQAQLRSGLTTLLAESVTARALEIQADLVLFMAQSPVIPAVVQELEKANVKTAFWFVEDAKTLNYWKGIAPVFKNFFVIQKDEFFDQLKQIGCHQPYYLPLAADPAIHYPLNILPAELEEYGSDLSHVGAGYYNRRQFFAGLLDFHLKIWGNEWDDAGILKRALQREGQRISTEETVKIFNATRINVNLHSSTYHNGVNPFGDFVNPRTFEIAACGAFQLVDQRKYLPEKFQLNSEVITFSSLQDFREKAFYYLEKPEERRRIADAARQRVLKEHTYENRMQEMLGVIASRDANWLPKGGGLPTAEEIIQQEGNPDSELSKIMQRFVNRGPLTLEDIAKEIEKGEGELCKTEAMILLLNEFRRWGLEKGVL